ncbi:ABC transporter substrate-binding protein [Lachnoclostridium phytofermentans]|uniref:Periplasmic binding protein n=1 Tax=Lachnoclostridium phytofermentans (strain ATCC 700394 / DSM 18823 / ISDg) TaxID=357809 RepID=A9KLK9_LACP7|nr:ABC transporter substrate-binding protein [Lachnoclostridium phytofermentans]ABX42753.1 periplasmic binding protein [Lachnoclostridium phytofermentans ISDg]
MTKKIYFAFLLLFVITFCGCSNGSKKESHTLIYDSNSPYHLYGSISLNQQIKTSDATGLYKLQKLPLAGIFPVRNYLAKQVESSYVPAPTKEPGSVQTNAKPNNNNSHVIIDASGFFTSFTTPPKKVAVLFSSYAQVWQDGGGVVSITVPDSINRGLVKKDAVTVIGNGDGRSINVERLLKLKPDLVILTNDFPEHVELAEILRDNEIKTLLFQVDSFLDYLTMLKSCTTILNTQDRYHTYGTEVLDTVEHIVEDTSNVKNPPKVLFLLASLQGIKVKGTNHFVGDMLNEMKAINIASESSILSDKLNPEIFSTSNVDQIYISIMEDNIEETKKLVDQEFIKNPAYQNLKAIKENKIYYLPKDLFSYKPNKNWGKAYEYLANLLYPKESP